MKKFEIRTGWGLSGTPHGDERSCSILRGIAGLAQL